jgi:hypothetical protein
MLLLNLRFKPYAADSLNFVNQVAQVRSLPLLLGAAA